MSGSEKEDSLEETLDAYRRKIDFDETSQISHPQDCYPGNCSLVGYKKDGELKYQEQTGKYPEVDPETPDWNPRGCSRQCSYTDATYGDERIRQPMKQTGERGSDNWKPISWEQAYEEIADAMIDAMEDHPQSIINELPPGEGGSVFGITAFQRLVAGAGGVNLDLESSTIQDFSAGMYETFGKFQFCSTQDEWFKADLNLIWHINPAYSRQSSYHFLTEARYNGSENVVIAPDYSPSCVHADRYVPVEPASDAALALGMCGVILDEGMEDRSFVKEQTDLPLLVKEEDGRFLRESDVEGEEEGSDEWFYVWDTDEGLTQAPRETLELGEIDPVLEVEGSFEAEIDGEVVELTTVYELVKDRLEEYDLETVQEITGVHPDVVRELAGKVARNRTSIVNSWNTCKTFHGDLIERSMALLLGLTGNWGREGTGMRSWAIIAGPAGVGSGYLSDEMMTEFARRLHDRELTDEEAESIANMMILELGSVIVPGSFFYYRHCGYDEVWDQAPMESAGIPRKTSEYVEEAIERDWWKDVDLPKEDVEPSIYFLVANNALRNKPGASMTLLKELWPKLDLVVSVDYRWSETALYSDIVLPGAFHHEKEQFHTLTSPELRFWSYAEQAVDPVHDAKNELEIAAGIARKVVERAEERGLDTYEVPHGVSVEDINEMMEGTGLKKLENLPPGLDESLGTERRYESFFDRFTTDLTEVSYEEMDCETEIFDRDALVDIVEAAVEDTVESGVFSEEASLEEIKERGFAKYEGIGDSVFGLNQASNVEPDETVTSLDKHVEDGWVFPTLTGRAQFYIDHDWFLEADEHLPRHKSPPDDHGGDRDEYPYFVTSGHNRHGTHGITLTNEAQMNQHRGEPHIFVSREAAEEKGIEDGDYVHVYNNYGEATVQAKVSSQPADDQVTIYHAWDQYLFPDGKSIKDLIPGLVKPLHFAGGYGHLRYRMVNWQQQHISRHVCVDFEPIEGDVDVDAKESETSEQ